MNRRRHRFFLQSKWRSSLARMGERLQRQIALHEEVRYATLKLCLSEKEFPLGMSFWFSRVRWRGFMSHTRTNRTVDR